eukprot:TRINITY_DN43737_c0_g1_i2.p1 TRINITY_DN43737_c0_g1~~TRINITY_DN43737_c0_g1_i2.p1  ORF type:complete len:567 (+),score=111.49 TRINITY_DN43737_c0_g1_i2:141-1841(+)
MASLRDLRVTLKKATPVEDHSTYRYHIQLQYEGTKWEVAKRFSEFDALLQSLAASRYAGLPKMPSKTLLGSPTDTAAIEGRKEQLRIVLYDLLSRPDTRTSQPLRQFLAIDSHTSLAIRSLQPDAMRTFEDPRFGVSGLCAAPSANLLLVTHEDSTHLSRLGRVWSVVEPDELGALHLWAPGSDGAWKRIFSRTFGIKVRSLAWEETTRQFFVGLEDGKIEVYGLTELSQPTPVAVLELHHKSPVTHLSASPRRLLSLGFDTAMRTVDIRSRELQCGGRLQKRLKNEMDYLTCGYLDDVRDRAFIGTSGDQIFILDISKNPPSFLHTIEMGASPISQIAVSEDALLVAHGDSLSVMSFEEKGREARTSRLGGHQSKHQKAEQVQLCAVAVAPSRRLVFGGYTDGSVAIWCNREPEAFVVMQAHQSEANLLVWVETSSWGPATLMTGGGDGKVITWNFSGESEDYAAWTPQQVDGDSLRPFEPPLGGSMGGYTATPAPAVVGAANLAEPDPFAPSWEVAAPVPVLGGGAGGADAFRMDGNVPRVNPQALKRADESDSDEGSLADAFH